MLTLAISLRHDSTCAPNFSCSDHFWSRSCFCSSKPGLVLIFDRPWSGVKIKSLGISRFRSSRSQVVKARGLRWISLSWFLLGLALSHPYAVGD